MTHERRPEWRRVVDEATKVRLHAPFTHARLAASADVPVVISVVKNERDLLDDFFAHYRLLGIERFIIIDNGSTDGSDSFCALQPDVELHIVRRPFSWPEKQGWINRAIAENGYDRWYLYADADERMVFDGAPVRSLSELTKWASHHGIRRIRGVMIDMYQNGPILDYVWPDGQSLQETFQLFDSDSYHEDHFEKIISRKGGPRKRVMGRWDPNFNPELSKYPLFNPRPGDIMENPHFISPCEDNFKSACFIGILHYKFLPSFMKKVQEAVSEANYWNNSSEYRVYLAALTHDQTTGFEYAGSAQYNTPQDLVSSNIISPIEWVTTRPDPLAFSSRSHRATILSEA